MRDLKCVGLLLLSSWRSGLVYSSLLGLVYRILSLKFILLDPDRAITARFINPSPNVFLHTFTIAHLLSAVSRAWFSL